jgi:hypothetical protein
LEQDALLALWLEGVPLGNAWLVFTDERNTARFYELIRTDSHLELQRRLKSDLVGHLRDGKRRALGVQEGSDPRLIVIPQYYFSRTAEVDWEKDKITAAGKTFHNVIVQWEREPPDEGQPRKPTRWIHPRELEALLEAGPPSEPGPVPGEQWDWESLDETLPNERESWVEPLTQAKLEAAKETPQSEPTPEKFGQVPSPLKVGRPSKAPEIEQAIELLLARGVDLSRMTRPRAFAAIKKCAANELNSDVTIGFHNSVIQVCLFRRFGPRR